MCVYTFLYSLGFICNLVILSHSIRIKVLISCTSKKTTFVTKNFFFFLKMMSLLLSNLLTFKSGMQAWGFKCHFSGQYQLSHACMPTKKNSFIVQPYSMICVHLISPQLSLRKCSAPFGNGRLCVNELMQAPPAVELSHMHSRTCFLAKHQVTIFTFIVCERELPVLTCVG